jgi:ATP-dependent Clp protease adaptor protein ClpS
VSGRSDITPLDLLVALFRGADQRRPSPRAIDLCEDPYRRVSAIIEHPMTALRQSGVTTAALLRYVAHGERAVAPVAGPDLAPAALVEVYLLNDDYTSMEFVVAALRDEFGLGALPAAELALQVHREGVGTLGTFRYAEVGAAVRRVEERAARLGFPLKVLVLEVDEG